MNQVWVPIEITANIPGTARVPQRDALNCSQWCQLVWPCLMHFNKCGLLLSPRLKRFSHDLRVFNSHDGGCWEISSQASQGVIRVSDFQTEQEWGLYLATKPRLSSLNILLSLRKYMKRLWEYSKGIEYSSGLESHIPLSVIAVCLPRTPGVGELATYVEDWLVSSAGASGGIVETVLW